MALFNLLCMPLWYSFNGRWRPNTWRLKKFTIATTGNLSIYYSTQPPPLFFTVVCNSLFLILSGSLVVLTVFVLFCLFCFLFLFFFSLASSAHSVARICRAFQFKPFLLLSLIMERIFKDLPRDFFITVERTQF